MIRPRRRQSRGPPGGSRPSRRRLISFSPASDADSSDVIGTMQPGWRRGRGESTERIGYEITQREFSMRRPHVVATLDEPNGWRRLLHPRVGRWRRHPTTKRGLPPGLFGAATLAVLLGTWCLPSFMVRDALRERGFDLLLPLLPERPVTGPGIAIIDIDRDTLARLGPWPWPRARLAALVGAVGAGKPAVIAFDVLLAGPDRFSAKALLGQAPGSLVAALPDGDRLMADALRAVPSVLGFGLDNRASSEDLPATPVLTSAAVSVPGIWQSNGLAGPPAELAMAAQGLGALVAAADPDGSIRRVPASCARG